MTSAISNIFGKTPKLKQVSPPATIVNQESNAQIGADNLRRKLAKMQRATMVSKLSEPNIRRKTLGAGQWT